MTHPPSNPYSSIPSSQRGAIGLFAALVMLLAVLFVALAVDTGRLELEKRRLQKIADMAALDASRALCSLNDVAAAAQASALRNGYTGNLITESGVRVGTTPTNEGVRQKLVETSAASANAVEVTARKTVPASLVAGGWFGGTVSLLAEGTAQKTGESTARIAAGSFLARLDTANSILNGLLGTNLNLDLGSYQGIAAGNVSLMNLIEAQAGVGTVQELLDLNMSLANWIDLTASALRNQHDDAATAAAVSLEGIAAVIPNGLTLKLADLLDVSQSPEAQEAALDAKLNAFDLLTLGAQVANGRHAIDIPILGISIPGVASIGVKLWVIQPPQISIFSSRGEKDGIYVTADNPEGWKAFVKTAQVNLGVSLGLVPGTLGIPLVATIRLVDLQLAVQIAPTKAWLEGVGCPTAASPNGSATVGSQPGIAALAIGKLDANGNVTGPANVATVKALLGLVSATIGVSASTQVISDPQTTEFDGPFPQTKTVSTPLGQALSNALGTLTNNLSFQVTVGGLPLGATLSAVVGILTPVLKPIITALGPILSPLLEPTLAALGVKLGGADLTVFYPAETGQHERPELVR